jgi:hypothetical protein
MAVLLSPATRHHTPPAMQNFRPLSIALAVFACAVGSPPVVLAQTSPEPAKAPPTGANAVAMGNIEFYLARGDADACGRGCNEWIAAEGKIDQSAAQRLRQLLTKLGRRRPPIYFHSPGGSIAGSLELGRLIHDQKFVVSIAHTVPIGCDQDKQGETPCEAQKRSGQAIEAAFDPNVAMCNSGCVYVVAGGAVRLVPPWVRPGIHDVGLDPTMKIPPRGAAAAEAKTVAHARIEKYLREIGIDKALLTAAAAIPFESVRFLERGEVARFGIDRREFGEAVWRFTDKPRPEMVKSFFVRANGDPLRYLNGVVVMTCGAGPGIRLGLVRAHGASELPGTWPHSVSISMSGQRIDLPYQGPSRDFDTRGGMSPASTLDKIGDNATIGVSGFDPGQDEGSPSEVTLNTDGFSAAYAKLRKSCGEPARDVIAVAPSTMPVGVPLPFGNSPFVQPPAAAGPTVSQNAAAAPIPPRPETLQSSANGSTTPAEPMGQSCALQIADAPEHRKGRVTGFLSDEEALPETKASEAQLGAKISPAYLSLKRARVEAYPGGGRWETGVGIPEHMAVEVGDLVELNSRYRDASLPCHFIPWTINRILDHAE